MKSERTLGGGVPPGRLLLFFATLGALLLAVWSASREPPPLWAALLVLGAYLVLLFVGALLPGLEMYGDVLSRCPSERAVALSFDDGPHPTFTPRVLDELRDAGAHATFFVIGQRALEHPEIVARMAREGHTVGVHGMEHHRGYAFLSAARVQADLEACKAALRRAGAPEPLWFRPPIGQASPPTFRGAQRAGMEVVGWSFRGFDGLRRTTPEALLTRATQALRPGAILLLHDAWERPRPDDAEPPAGARALGSLLKECRQRGLDLVNLDELVQEAVGRSATKRAPPA